MLEYINADDVITFCPYVMDTMRLIPFKIRSCVSCVLDRFSSYLLVDEVLLFDWLTKHWEMYSLLKVAERSFGSS